MHVTPAQKTEKSKLPLIAGIGVGIVTALFVAYLEFSPRPVVEETPLSAEAEAYAQKLNLANIQMAASLNYFSQRVVEISGDIENTGDRPIQLVEIYCIFRDYSGVELLRSRVAIVSAKMNGLAPGETKQFRLPFDEVPDNWNQELPQIYIAGLEFGS